MALLFLLLLVAVALCWEGKRVDEVNKMAELGTRLAHVDGGVPNILVNVPELNAR